VCLIIIIIIHLSIAPLHDLRPSQRYITIKPTENARHSILCHDNNSKQRYKKTKQKGTKKTKTEKVCKKNVKRNNYESLVPYEDLNK